MSHTLIKESLMMTTNRKENWKCNLQVQSTKTHAHTFNKARSTKPSQRENKSCKFVFHSNLIRGWFCQILYLTTTINCWWTFHVSNKRGAMVFLFVCCFSATNHFIKKNTAPFFTWIPHRLGAFAKSDAKSNDYAQAWLLSTRII